MLNNNLLSKTNLTIRTRIAFVIFFFIALLSALLLILIPWQIEKLSMATLQTKAASIADMTAYTISPAVVFDDIGTVEEAIRNVKRNKEISSVIVCNKENIIASCQKDQIMDYIDRASHSKEYINDKKNLLISSRDILFNGNKIGKVYLGVSLNGINAEVSNSRSTITIASLAIFIAGAFFAAWLSRMITKRLSKLVEAINSIAEGNISLRADAGTNDEVGILAASFNSMLDNLETTHRELEDINLNLEQRVKERTRQLEAETEERKKAQDSYIKVKEQLMHAQKMEAIGTLAGGIAHDFNNMLTGIIINAELTQAVYRKGEAIGTYLERIIQAAKKASGITRQLLTFARKKTDTIKVLDVNDCIAEAIGMVERTLNPMTNLRFDRYPGILPAAIDGGQIQQAAINLMINASDAMPNGGSLTVKTGIENQVEEVAEPGDYIFMRITDTGCGIEPESLDRIFEPFFTTKEAGKGTGLGLAMVWSAARSHGGWVNAVSTVGEGTTFTFYLPLSSKGLESDSYTEDNGNEKKQGTILLVDDDEEIRSMGKEMLEINGYKVLIASDGVEAIEVFSKHNAIIDLVILDMLMPKKSGRDTIPELIKLNPKAKIIVSSGYSQETKLSCQSLGAKSYLPKPYTMRDMIRAIEQVI